jgi:hypothetical protein
VQASQGVNNTSWDLLVGGAACAGRRGFGAFVQQKPAQGAEVVQKPAAAVQMVREFIKFELHQLQGLKAASEAGVGGSRKVGIDLPLAFEDRVEQQAHVLLGIFDAIKRSLRRTTQARSSLEIWRRGWDLHSDTG